MGIESSQTKPQPRPFDLEDCIQRFNNIVEPEPSAVNYSRKFKFNWRKLKLEKFISQEEAKFWIVAMIKTCQFFNNSAYSANISRQSVDEITSLLYKWRSINFTSVVFTLEEVIARLITAKGYYQDTAKITAICLINLFPIEKIFISTILSEQSQSLKLREIVKSNISERQLQDYIDSSLLVRKKLARGKNKSFIWDIFYYDAKTRFQCISEKIVREYTESFLSYQSQAETEKFKTFIKPYLSNLLDFDYIFRELYFLIDKLDMIEELVASWTSYIFDKNTEEYYIEIGSSEEINLQDIVFQIKNPEKLKEQVYRLGIPLTTSSQVKTWLTACKNYSELEYIKDSILEIHGKNQAERKANASSLILAFGSAKTSEITPYMLELSLSSPAGQVAKNWLRQNPEHTIPELIPIAIEGESLGKAAVDILQDLKLRRHEELIIACLEEEEKEISEKLKEHIFNYTGKAEVAKVQFDRKTTPDWLKDRAISF